MAMSVKVQIIYNPASGTHCDRKLDALQRAFENCDASVLLSQTSIEGDIQFAPDCDLLCVSGGDGALRLVVRSAARANLETPICVYPAGTVNLIAKELSYPSDPSVFASQVMAGLTKGDSARINAPLITYDDQPFVACLSAGPDGLAVAQHSPALKKHLGGTAYAVAAMKLLFKWPRFQFDLEVHEHDGPAKMLSCEAFYVAKAYHYAGNWTLAPEANLASNQFYLLALRSAKRRHFLRFIMQVAMGRDLAKLDFIDKISARSMTIKSAPTDLASRAFQIDGDALPHSVKNVNITDKTITYCLPIAG